MFFPIFTSNHNDVAFDVGKHFSHFFAPNNYWNTMRGVIIWIKRIIDGLLPLSLVIIVMSPEYVITKTAQKVYNSLILNCFDKLKLSRQPLMLYWLLPSLQLDFDKIYMCWGKSILFFGFYCRCCSFWTPIYMRGCTITTIILNIAFSMTHTFTFTTYRKTVSTFQLW